MAAAEMPERSKLIITIAISVVLNLVFWGVVYKLNNDYKALDKNLKKVKEEAAKFRERASQRAAVDNTLKKLKTENELREKKLPELRDQDKIITDLAEMEQKFHVVNKSVNPEYNKAPDLPGVNPQSFTRDIWRLKYECDFAGLSQILNYFEEHYPRFINMSNLSVIAKDGGMNITGAMHNVSLDVETYRYVRNSTGP